MWIIESADKFIPTAKVAQFFGALENITDICKVTNADGKLSPCWVTGEAKDYGKHPHCVGRSIDLKNRLDQLVPSKDLRQGEVYLGEEGIVVAVGHAPLTMNQKSTIFANRRWITLPPHTPNLMRVVATIVDDKLLESSEFVSNKHLTPNALEEKMSQSTVWVVAKPHDFVDTANVVVHGTESFAQRAANEFNAGDVRMATSLDKAGNTTASFAAGKAYDLKNRLDQIVLRKDVREHEVFLYCDSSHPIDVSVGPTVHGQAMFASISQTVKKLIGVMYSRLDSNDVKNNGHLNVRIVATMLDGLLFESVKHVASGWVRSSKSMQRQVAHDKSQHPDGQTLWEDPWKDPKWSPKTWEEFNPYWAFQIDGLAVQYCLTRWATIQSQNEPGQTPPHKDFQLTDNQIVAAKQAWTFKLRLLTNLAKHRQDNKVKIQREFEDWE